MNEVNLDTLSSFGLGTQKSSSSNKTENELGQEQFLELMIAQIQNQDPFKPLENGEFLTQIAQFSTVSGVQDLQESFSSLAGSLSSNQALQASALVGRSVLVPSDAGVLNAGGTVQGSVELQESSGEVRLQVFNAAGEVVRTLPLGAQQAGSVGFTWDGTADDGTVVNPGLYRITASSVKNGEQEALETFISDRVESVTLGRAGEGTILNLASLGATDFKIIQEIR